MSIIDPWSELEFVWLQPQKKKQAFNRITVSESARSISYSDKCIECFAVRVGMGRGLMSLVRVSDGVDKQHQKTRIQCAFITFNTAFHRLSANFIGILE